MFLGNNVEIKLNNPSDEFTLGIHFQAAEGYPYDEETGETNFDVEPKEVYSIILGFLIFNVVIYW